MYFRGAWKNWKGNFDLDKWSFYVAAQAFCNSGANNDITNTLITKTTAVPLRLGEGVSLLCFLLLKSDTSSNGDVVKAETQAIRKIIKAMENCGTPVEKESLIDQNKARFTTMPAIRSRAIGNQRFVFRIKVIGFVSLSAFLPGFHAPTSIVLLRFDLHCDNQELHDDTDQWVRLAASNERVIITDDGRPIAALTSLEPSPSSKRLPDREAKIS